MQTCLPAPPGIGRPRCGMLAQGAPRCPSATTRTRWELLWQPCSATPRIPRNMNPKDRALCWFQRTPLSLSNHTHEVGPCDSLVHTTQKSQKT